MELTAGPPKKILEPIVVEAMFKHRFLRDVAELRHKEIGRSSSSEDVINSAQIAYIWAMIDVHAQQTVVSVLIDTLGYIPETPDD